MRQKSNRTTRNSAVALAGGFSRRVLPTSSTDRLLSLAPGPSPVRWHGDTRSAISLAPGFSRVESGGGNQKTVLTVFLDVGRKTHDVLCHFIPILAAGCIWFGQRWNVAR